MSTLSPTVPETLIALVNAAAAEAASIGAPMTEAHKDALTRALYPLVDEAHTLRRHSDVTADRLERERDRVATADLFEGLTFQQENQAAAFAYVGPDVRVQIRSILQEHPATRRCDSSGPLAPAVQAALDLLYADNLELRRRHAERDAQIKQLIAERDDTIRWQRVAQQIAETLGPFWPTEPAPNEHNVIWLTEKIVDHIQDLRSQVTTRPEVTSETVTRCQQLNAIRVLLHRHPAVAGLGLPDGVPVETQVRMALDEVQALRHDVAALGDVREREQQALTRIAVLDGALNDLLGQLIDGTQRLDLCRAQAALVSPHDEAAKLHQDAERYRRLGPLLATLRAYVARSGDAVPAELWYALQERYEEAVPAELWYALQERYEEAQAAGLLPESEAA